MGAITTNMAKKLDISQMIKRLEKEKSDLPALIANDALKYFTGSFHRQQWDGQKWPEVKRREEGTPEYKYPKTKDLQRRKRGILYGPDRTLYKAVQNSLRSVSWAQIVFGVDTDHGQYHNDGMGHNPKRKFIGTSRYLQGKIRDRIVNAMKNIFTNP
jgi:hypothetical protein